MRDIYAAILAGGFGTRLRPAVHGTPKVLARVGNRPFLTMLLDRLELSGIQRVVLLTGFQADQVHQTLGDHYGTMKLAYSVEAAPLGTGGALRHALPHLDTDTLLLLNGDSFCDVDLEWLIARHLYCQADMSLALTHVSDASRFGQVEFAADEALTRFHEKRVGTGAGWINAGVYVLQRTLIAEIPRDWPVSLEQELLPTWIRHRRLYGFRSTGRFLDIGTPESYAAATAFFAGLEQTNCVAAPMTQAPK